MMIKLLAIFALLLCACPKPADLVSPDPFTELRYSAEQAKLRTVQLVVTCPNGDRGYGSGVAISGSEVLTAEHVVRNKTCAYHAYLHWRSSMDFFEPLTIERNKSSDIARLKFKSHTFPFEKVQLAISPELGDPVLVLGWPRDMFTGKHVLTATRGNLAATYAGWRFRYTAPITKGSSGGGVFLANGKLVGVATSLFSRFNIPIDGNYLGTGWPALDPLL